MRWDNMRPDRLVVFHSILAYYSYMHYHFIDKILVDDNNFYISNYHSVLI